MRASLLKFAALVGVAALAATACGGDNSSTSKTSAPAVTTAAPTSGPSTSGTGTSGGSTAPSGATTTPAPPSGEPWVIAAVIPLSGPTAPFFTSALNTYKGAVKYLNENLGGIAGRPVTLETIDSAGQPAQAVSALQSYLDSHTPQMVIASQVSALSAPLLPILTNKKIFSSASTVAKELNDPAKYPYHFPAPPTTDQVESAAATYLKEQGFKKVAFLGPNNASGQSSLAALQAAAPANGLEITSALMDPTSLDATPQLTQLKDSNPDVLLMNGYGGFAGVFLKGKTKIGWDVKSVGDETFAANDLGGVASSSDIKGLKLQFFAYSIKGDPGSTTPVAQYLLNALGPKNNTPLWAQALNWNFFILAKMAGDKAGASADGPALADALQTFQEIPAELKASFFGDPKLGFSSTNHTPQWQPTDWTWTNAGPLENSLLVPQS
jgi:branched-chain amino acid transport system substrate-binding protein